MLEEQWTAIIFSIVAMLLLLFVVVWSKLEARRKNSKSLVATNFGSSWLLDRITRIFEKDDICQIVTHSGRIGTGDYSFMLLHTIFEDLVI